MAGERNDWNDDSVEGAETTGIVLGIRIVEEGGEFHLAEAEIAAYLDEPNELGVTLVFHPLADLDLEEVDDDDDWPAWPIDIDDDLTVDATTSLREQFASIVRQLHALSEPELRDYLRKAREAAETASD